MKDDDLVVVFDAPNEVTALLYRTMLEEAGIDVVEKPLEDEMFEGVRQLSLHSQLLVEQADAERAARLVEAFRAEAESGELSAEIPEQSDNAGPEDDATPDEN